MPRRQEIYDPSRPRLLVVDDDPTLCLVMEEALRAYGWEVTSAKNGREGCALAERDRFDVILIDVVMPELDGFDLCRAIRSTEKGSDTPILMITGLNDIGCIERAYEAGATDFVTKPINWALLPRRLKYVLRASRAFVDLRTSEIQLNMAQQIAQVGSWEWNPATNLTRFSQQTAEILALSSTATERGIYPLLVNATEEYRADIARKLVNAERGRMPVSVEFLVAAPGSSVRHVFLRAEWVYDPQCDQDIFTGTVQDVTAQRQAAEQIRRLAYYDPLTGLANRTLFKEKLVNAIASCEAVAATCAVLFIDVDNFKFINDSHGHDAGDAILLQLSERLQRLVDQWCAVQTESDTISQTLVARIGGDEFTVLLPQVGTRDSVSALAKVLRNACREVFYISEMETVLSVSIGISFYPSDADTISDLLKAADVAMYHAKRMGKNNYQFYDPAVELHGKRRAVVQAELRKALESDAFELYYQPRINVETGAISGVEALLRWHSSKLGIIAPAEFIPIAEATGLIVPIGEWVLERAFKDARSWFHGDVREPVRLAVNISACQFKHPTFLHVVKRCLGQFARVDLLELEITESVLLDESETTRSIMAALKEMGFRIVVDDFGAGYASLSYLKRFPINALKIDRSFIRGLPNANRDAVITTAIIDLTRNLQLDVVAEGVENIEQLNFLKERRCPEVQGYFFSKAVTHARIGQMLAEQRLAARMPAAQAMLRKMSHSPPL